MRVPLTGRLTRYLTTPLVVFVSARVLAPWVTALLLSPLIRLRAPTVDTGFVIGADAVISDLTIALTMLFTLAASLLMFRLENAALTLGDHFRSCVLLYAVALIAVVGHVKDLIDQSQLVCYMCPPAWYEVVPPALAGNALALYLSSRAKVAA